jgi:hypothetical protein
MKISQFILFVYIVNAISGQYIDVLFDNTITIDNSTITWSNKRFH